MPSCVQDRLAFLLPQEDGTMQESFGKESTQDDTTQDDTPAREARQEGEKSSKAVDQQLPTRKTRKKRKLTDEAQTQICAMIGVGCSLRTAARLAGCSESAIRNLARHDDAFATRLREASVRREVFPLR